MPLLQEDGLEGRVDGRVDGRGEGTLLGGRESQGERVRRSLVRLDNALPAIALPDGVHCRSFTGATPAPSCAKQPCRCLLSPVKASALHCIDPWSGWTTRCRPSRCRTASTAAPSQVECAGRHKTCPLMRQAAMPVVAVTSGSLSTALHRYSRPAPAGKDSSLLDCEASAGGGAVYQSQAWEVRVLSVSGC